MPLRTPSRLGVVARCLQPRSCSRSLPPAVVCPRTAWVPCCCRQQQVAQQRGRAQGSRRAVGAAPQGSPEHGAAERQRQVLAYRSFPSHGPSMEERRLTWGCSRHRLS
jgi:hypothetical protein